MCYCSHSSGSNGHVVSVAGWPLGAAVAAQVLVDAGQLVSRHIIRHLQVWVVAEGLGAPHVHRIQEVLAVHHSDLPQGEETERWFFFYCQHTVFAVMSLLSPEGVKTQISRLK